MSQYSQSCLSCCFPSKRKFHFFPFCFKNKIEKNKRENREGCWEWSHVTDVGKNADFSPHHWFFFCWWIVIYVCDDDQNSSYLTFSLFSLSFSLCYFRLLLWVLAATFITATVDVSIRYYTWIRMKKKRPYGKRGIITYSVAASGSIHYQMQITVTHTDKSSLFSFFKHNRQLRGWVFFWFFYTGCCWLDGWMAGWWVPLIVFLLFCVFRRHRILIFGKTKPQIRLEDSTLDTGYRRSLFFVGLK